MALDVVHRIIHIRMIFIAFGQKDRSTQIDGLPPEVGQDLALEFNALDPHCIFRHFNGWDDFVASERYGFFLGRIEMDFDDVANDVSRRAGPSLALPLIIMHPDRVAIRSLEFCVDIYNALDIVLIGGEIFYTLKGIAEHLLI
jgi:hypothetical protein